MRPLNLAEKAESIEPVAASSPRDTREFGRGYAVMSLPFSSGHCLGLRVFPQNTFAPYVSVWHQSPDGAWSIYVAGPSLDTTCPRYWGGATEHDSLTTIDVTWTGPNDLAIEMEEPELVWSLSVTAPTALRWVNSLNAALPDWTWRIGPALRFREWFARRFLGMGDIRLAFRTASGHDTVLMAQENYFIDESAARLDGASLGEPVELDRNPTIGDVPLPSIPSFIFGQAQMAIVDHDEYRSTLQQFRDR